jgi:transposase
VVGRKRHVLTDTLGLLLAVNVHPASVQDRDGAEALLREARRSFPFIERVIGDAGYQGRRMEAAVARTGVWELQIVRRCDKHRFVVLPKRWIVERTLGWLNRARRLAKDFEALVESSRAWVMLALGFLLIRRAARDYRAST